LLIVDVIIKELFYCNDNQILTYVNEVDDEDEENHHMNMEQIRKKAEKKIALKHNAMKLFKLDEDDDMYMVDVPNNTHFFLVVDYVNAACHFNRPLL
jgi:hypothetical protein